MTDAARFSALWSEIEPVGRGPVGYERFSWGPEDMALRAWFEETATARGLDVEHDRNGNLWAWCAPATTADADDHVVATGSHLDSVPGGGAFDGPLGVVGGLLALETLRARHGPPRRPVAVAVFSEEEGARFGVACLGSRLATGAIDPARARALRDHDGTSLAEAMRTAGADPDALGPDDARIARIGAFVELHVEQGRALGPLGASVGIASGVWPHGRWRLRFDGEANHAGTALLEDRRDPLLPFAATVAAARAAALAHGGLATVGRADIVPNATNGVASSVEAWLDARAPERAALGSIVADVRLRANASAADHGVRLDVAEESSSGAVEFDPQLRATMREALGGTVAELATGAGHDAGILAARVRAGMLFVRNPTGVSHSPAEQVSIEDCVAGIDALMAVLEALAWR